MVFGDMTLVNRTLLWVASKVTANDTKTKPRAAVRVWFVPRAIQLGAGKKAIVHVEVAEWWTLPSSRKEIQREDGQIQAGITTRRTGYPYRVQA